MGFSSLVSGFLVKYMEIPQFNGNLTSRKE